MGEHEAEVVWRGPFSKSLFCTEEKEDPRVRRGKSQKGFCFEVRKKNETLQARSRKIQNL